MSSTQKVVGILAVVLALIATLSRRTMRAANAVPQSPAAVSLTFTNGKVCSGYIGGAFRDSIIVPDSYRISDCEALAKKMILGQGKSKGKGFSYDLGCLTGNSFTWGTNPGQPPNPNPCQWGQ